MSRRLLLCLFLLCPFRVFAQDVGVAYFALPSTKFPCDVALEVFKDVKRPALAILWDTFGTDTICLEKWFRLVGDRPHTLQIHPFNQPCRRNKRCENVELFHDTSTQEFNKLLEQKDPELLQEISRRIAAIRSVIAPHRNEKGEYIISTGLEDNYSPAAYKVMYEAVRTGWDGTVVRNPEGRLTAGVPLEGADYIEAHSANPQFAEGQKCIANLDGEDVVFPHRKATTLPRASWQKTVDYVRKYKKQCRLTLLWASPWQGILSPKFVPPSNRTFAVTREDIQAVRPLLLE